MPAVATQERETGPLALEVNVTVAPVAVALPPLKVAVLGAMVQA